MFGGRSRFTGENRATQNPRAGVACGGHRMSLALESEEQRKLTGGGYGLCRADVSSSGVDNARSEPAGMVCA